MKDIPLTDPAQSDPEDDAAAFEIRKGQSPGRLQRSEFSTRFRETFIDPAFRREDGAIGRLEEIAWEAYIDGRKAPLTQKAGPGYGSQLPRRHCFNQLRELDSQQDEDQGVGHEHQQVPHRPGLQS